MTGANWAVVAVLGAGLVSGLWAAAWHGGRLRGYLQGRSDGAWLAAEQVSDLKGRLSAAEWDEPRRQQDVLHGLRMAEQELIRKAKDIG